MSHPWGPRNGPSCNPPAISWAAGAGAAGVACSRDGRGDAFVYRFAFLGLAPHVQTCRRSLSRDATASRPVRYMFDTYLASARTQRDFQHRQ